MFMKNKMISDGFVFALDRQRVTTTFTDKGLPTPGDVLNEVPT
jgi:hypothetical protein